MKIRRDAAFVSSVLFTVAFMCLIPPMLPNTVSGRQAQDLEAPWREVARLFQQLSIASVVIIFIGLIVTWAGYVYKIRWTWLVMRTDPANQVICFSRQKARRERLTLTNGVRSAQQWYSARGTVEVFA